MNKMKGKVVFFDGLRGWGFVRPDGTGDDVFVHHSQVGGPNRRKALTTGSLVEFEIGSHSGRVVAVNVRPLIEQAKGAVNEQKD